MAAISPYQAALHEETTRADQSLVVLKEFLKPAPLLQIVKTYLVDSPEKIGAKIEIQQILFTIQAPIAQCKNYLNRCFVLFTKMQTSSNFEEETEAAAQMAMTARYVEQTSAVINENMSRLATVWQTYSQFGILDPDLIRRYESTLKNRFALTQ